MKLESEIELLGEASKVLRLWLPIDAHGGEMGFPQHLVRWLLRTSSASWGLFLLHIARMKPRC